MSKGFLLKISAVIATLLVLVPAVVLADTGIKDFFFYNYLKRFVYSNPAITQWVFGSTTTTTDDRVEIYGDAYVSSTLTTGEVCLDSDCISDWSSIQGTNYWSDDGTNLSPVTSTRGVSVTGLTTDTLNISTITNECLETDADGNVVGSGSACGSGGGGLSEITSVGDGTSLVADGTNGYVKSVVSSTLIDVTDNGNDITLTVSSSPTFGQITATSGTSTLPYLSSTLSDIYDLIIGNALTFISGVIKGAVNATGLWTFDVLPKSTAIPTDDDDLTNKLYVDAFSQGLVAKNSCIVATTEEGDLDADFENGDTVDTYALVTGDRILIKDQTTTSTQNGIYTVNASGAPTRATDYDENDEVQEGTYTYIINGGENENTQWVQYQIDPVLDTDPILFRALPAPPDFTGSNGIKMVGSDAQINHDPDVSGLTTSSDKLAVNYDDSSIGILAGQLAVKALGITNEMLAGLIDLTTKVTGILPIVNGGTGASTASGALNNLLPSQTGNTGKALVTDGSDVSWSTVASDGGASVTSTFGNTKQLDWIKYSSIWTNMPTSTTILLGSANYYKKMDLTNSYRFRTIRSLSVAGLAGSYIKLQYSTDRVNWYDAASSEGDCSLVGTGSVPCPWVTLVTGARTDVWLRYVGAGGDGIVDPRFYDLTTEFTTYASIEQSNATSSVIIPMALPPTYQTWSNIPYSKSGTYYIGWGSTAYYKTANLYRANKYRIIHRISTTTDAQTVPENGSKIDLQYSYNKTNWFNANSGLASPATSTGEVDISVGLNDINAGNWVDVAEGAKGAVWLRIVGYSGTTNSTKDPRFNYVAIEFDVDLNADVTSESFSTSSADTWLDTKDKGYFWSTTSADFWGAAKGYLTNLLGGLNAIFGNTTTTNLTITGVTNSFLATDPTGKVIATTSPTMTESDPVFMAASTSLAYQPIGSYLTTESDPIWTATSSNYLTILNASNTYYRITNPDGYITSSALLPYLTTSSAASIYQPIGSYLIAESDPIWLAASSSYLTTTTASATYQPIGSYLTSETDPIWSNASSSYLTTTTASSTYFKISTWLAQTTDNLTEGITNLYFTIARARESISSLIPAITYSTSTGQLSLTSGYEIPLSASTTNWNSAYNIVNSSSTFWDTAYSWGNHALAGYLTTISGLNISLLNNDAGYITTTPAETDPVWSLASTSVAYLANNQTFTGENTFTGLTQLATTTATGTLSVTGAVSGGLNSQFGSAGNYLKVEEFDALPGIGFNMPMISMYNDNNLGLPNDVGAIRKGLFIADPDAGIPLIALTGSTLADPYATIIYSTSSNVLIIDADATTDGSQLYIQEADIGGQVYPTLTGIDDDGENPLGLAITNGLMLYNPTGNPLIGWYNGSTSQESLMTYGEDGLTLIGGIDAVANATTSVGNGIVISETYRSSGRLLGDAGVGARAGVLFRDNAGGGLLGPDKDLGLLNSVVIEQAGSSGDPWEGGMELYTFASTTGKSSSTKNVSYFVDKNVFNDDGLDLDFIVESDINANALFLDGASGYLGLGTSTPQYNLSIVTSSNWLSMTRSDGYGLWFDWVTSTIDFPIIRGLASTTAIFGLDLSAVPLAESAVLVDEDSDNETSLSFMNNPLTIIAGLVYNFLINSFTFSGFKIMNFENWDADANFFILDAENEDVFITSGSSWAGYATCYTTNGELGHCTSAVASDGHCTCASNN